MPAGRPRKFKTAAALRRAADRYFDSISYVQDVKDLLNMAGEPVKLLRYVQPPTVTGLCLHLGIDRSTWQNYGDESRDPETAAVVRYVRQRIEAWLEQELLSRDKSVQGIIFNLQNNYGWRARSELELGRETRASMQLSDMSLQDKLSAIAEAARHIDAGGAEDGTPSVGCADSSL